MIHRIRQRLVLSHLLVAAVPLVAVGFYTMHSHTQALTALAQSSARDRVVLKARKVSELLGEQRSDLVFLARSPAMMSLFGDDDRAGRKRLAQQFLSFASAKSVFASLFYLDEEGDEVVLARHDGQRSWLVPDDELRRRALSSAFRATMAQAPGEVYAEALDRRSGEAQEPVVRYAVRVADGVDRPRGVLVADLFARRIVDTVRDDRSYTWLLDEVGWTVSPSAEAPPSTDPEDLADIRDQLRSAQTVAADDGGTTITWTLVFPVAAGAAPAWLLAERMPESEVFASVRRFRLVFGGLVFVVVLAAALLSLALARRISAPIDRLAEGARRLADGDLTHRLDIRTGDEFELLASEFNRMGGALHDSRERVLGQLEEREQLAVLGQLSAGLAHEINNPAGVVSMYAEQLLENDDLSPAQRDKLLTIERHADRMGRITSGLLDFSRVGTERHDRVDVAASVRQAVAAMEPRWQQSGADVRLHLTEGCYVEGDQDQLQQVWENLVLNATQAAPGGQVDIRMQQGADVQIIVSDNGSGIAQQNLGRIFEPFFTTKEVGEGTGLGLSISYGIIKAHGGKLSAENRPEGGASFVVRLPGTEGAT